VPCVCPSTRPGRPAEPAGTAHGALHSRAPSFARDLPTDPHLQVLEFEREAARLEILNSKTKGEAASKTIQDLQRENAKLKYALHRQ